MRQRGITLAQIRRVLGEPDLVEPDREDAELEHALKRFPRRRGPNALRVVYNVNVFPVRIVTVFFERHRRSNL